jgi:hypothetical protein
VLNDCVSRVGYLPYLKRARSMTYRAEMWYGFPRRWSFQKPVRQKRKPSMSLLLSQKGV